MNKIKIMIIEDEILIALDIKYCLEKLGYLVTKIVGDYKGCINSFLTNKPDIIISDIYLNDINNGIEIIKKIKKIENVPVIFLSSYSSDILIKETAYINADGYLIKPFHEKDLHSTILLILHKIKKEKLKKKCYELDRDYIFNYDRDIVTYKGNKVKLSKNEILLLKILIQSKEKVVSFETIEHLIWYDKVVSDSSVRTLLYRLRKKLNNDIIETIHTFGCKLKYIKQVT